MTETAYLTSVVTDAVTGREIAVGWDLCFKCKLHITLCPCPEPTPPNYVTHWNGKPEVSYGGGQEAVSYVVPERTKAARDPKTGRRVRSDKGVKRVAEIPKEISRERREPCPIHTAESKLNDDGLYVCTVEGCTA